MSLKTFTAEDLKQCADSLTARMQIPTYETTFADVITQLGGPPQPPVLLQQMEKLQVEELGKIGYADGDKALADLKGAVKRFPDDKALRESIIALCNTEEQMLARIQKMRAEALGIKLMDPEEMMRRQQQAMKMQQEAMMSLPQDRQDRMKAISMKMQQTRQMPPEEDRLFMQECQQMMMAYIETMQEMMATMGEQ